MIIVTNGPPASGKDAACEYLKDRGFVHIEFKEALFEDVINYFDVSKEWFFNGYTREQKNVREEFLGGMSRREALIFVSEEVVKPSLGDGYYGKVASDKMLNGVDYCISDGGFVEELSHIINKFSRDDIVVVRLYRDGSDYNGDSRKYVNCDTIVSEYVLGKKTDTVELDRQCFEDILELDCVVVHNNGTISDLCEALDDIIRTANARKDENRQTREISVSGKSI